MSQPFLIPSLDDQNFGFVGLPASGSAAAPVLPLTVSCSLNLSEELSMMTELSEMVCDALCQALCVALQLFQSAALIMLNTSSIQIHADMIYLGKGIRRCCVY